ncbi:MAG TPA: hypothetical protein PLD25_20620 [Chloroflexota bacterium]|nr:hypothetical protein [Chloroflexota bacterium]HUM69955.1 hypothetical protein [Chloroflexota bacterium]
MDNHLADKRHMTLILRLAIDKENQLVHGELVNLRGVVIGRFMEWPKLTQMIQTWISNQDDDQSNDNPDNPETIKTS